MPNCRAVINDSYKTECSLIYPPYIVALGCLHVACVLTQKDITHWWERLSCNLNQVSHLMEDCPGYLQEQAASGCRCRILPGFCKVMKVVTGMLLLQVHEVTMDIFSFYEKLREPLTAEMCHRYLEILR